MTKIRFTKMHATGNDFVVLDGRGELPSTEFFARDLSHRQFGIGFDQLLILRPSQIADFRMEIRNADGGEVEMCGNGIRAFFKFLRDRQITNSDEIRVETLAGVVTPRWLGGNRIAVDMGKPILSPAKIPTTLGQGNGPVLEVPLAINGVTLSVSCVSMGNPHAVFDVEDLDATAVDELGPQVETHPSFPNRTNVEFVQKVSGARLRQRTWERGVGETLACGSGACAVVVASILRGRCERNVCVELQGGELEIDWPKNDASVMMTGSATEVFEGHLVQPSWQDGR